MNQNKTPPSADYLRACRDAAGLSLSEAADLLTGEGFSKSPSAAKQRLHRMEKGHNTAITISDAWALRRVVGADPVVLVHLYAEEEPSPAALDGLDRAVCTWAFLNLEAPGVMDAWVELVRARKAGGARYFVALDALHALSAGGE